ncbi:hypothetical protein JMJ77_0010956 [Colletotrichum scovillei]|uniref:Uncharacterized protein n=1 Tax=Colletotrichum scovillei TaxID=1209932 RepID=A0A9P7R329_9PEZI|nr:hypothetical protein JMJ77_0010956 [Colletotrichum scovillei]KAG7059922.1 hypothetical protein JMJ78_0015207 [Colletotrichum scovillei]KAG7067374.1 hypothetical protein JMJ76_0008813 [Colletotrichum scovillei]
MEHGMGMQSIEFEALVAPLRQKRARDVRKLVLGGRWRRGE